MVAKRDFTDRFLKAIKAAKTGKRVIIYDAQIPGFGIRITDRSTKESAGAFVLVTRFPGSRNPAPRRIGDYPAMSLTKAREIAREWREDLRTGKVVKRAVEKHVYPQWADRPIPEIKRADVNELIRSFRRGAPIGANRLLAYLKKFFAWAVDQELIEASPALWAAKQSPSGTCMI